MATILGTWELGRGYGHIAHLAPIAHALGAAGHRTAAAVREPATAESTAGQPFSEVLQAPLYRLPPGPRQTTLTYAQVIADGGFADAPAAIALVRAWLELFEQVRPDAVIAEHAPVSLLAAHVAGLPAAITGAGFMVPPATRPLPALMPWIGTTVAERRTAEAAADATVRAVCAAFGAARLDGLAELLGRARPYVTTWPELDIYGPRKGATYYGPMSGFGGTARPDWPEGQGPRCVVYLPALHARRADLAEALGELGWPTIWHSTQAPAEALPTTIRYVPEPLDLPHVLGEAELVAGHGSHGTCGQALAAGCVQVLLPATLEQILTSRVVVRSDLGVATNRRGPQGVRQALELAAERPGIRAAVEAAKARYARYRPELAAAQLAAALVRDLNL